MVGEVLMMNPVSAFLMRNIVVVFFVYGLAFFSMGLALVLAGRHTSAFRLARAIYPLALFGILHGMNEWMQMLSLIADAGGVYVPPVAHNALRLGLLVLSFVMLFLCGLLLLLPEKLHWRQVYLPAIGIVVVWALAALWVARRNALPPSAALLAGDALSRYLLAIPGALLSSWAFLKQQEIFQRHGMPQFGRDLRICAAALLGYGVVGQVFVHQTALFPSTLINDALFVQWFGVPVQLLRAVMAVVIAVSMVHALSAFEVENQRRLEAANKARLKAQAAAIETERRISRETERLNQELQLTTRELSVMLDVSNLLVAPMSLRDRLHRVLERIGRSLNILDAAMILLPDRETRLLRVRAATGFDGPDGEPEGQYTSALKLGRRCALNGMAVCQKSTGSIVGFRPREAMQEDVCLNYIEAMTMIALPLTARQNIVGSIVLVRRKVGRDNVPLFNEFKLMVGLGQQLGLSIENARLQQEAHHREEMLAELLHQVVGAQEAERQRIARELHDATGQSLSAIGLGLRGVETILAGEPDVAARQIKALKSFSATALGELRHIIADLRPSQLDDLGLVAALQWYVQTFQKRYPVAADLVVTGSPVRLPAEYETVVFRIAQEMLTNVAKHARASQARVQLQFEPAQLRLTVTDDGCGFEPESAHWKRGERSGWGLLGIQERAALIGGAYNIDSAPGRGTKISVKVPLIAEAEHVEDTVAAG
ncbi:MAG: histidine kinase [Anaerolineae bacterium]